jgi:uncharacterized protein YeeX (DUF496 family)
MSVNRVVESFETAIDGILSSWTALDLAIGHYDGSIRDAKEKRAVLLESLSDAIRQEKYEVNDIAEFINDYMYENFFMELDDHSEVSVARVSMDAWIVCKQGRIPQIPGGRNGASSSVLQDLAVEVDDEIDDGDEDIEMADDSHVTGRLSNPKTITDDDGWTTIVPKNQ